MSSPVEKTQENKDSSGVCWGSGEVYLSAGPQVVDDSLDSVHHLQPHLLLLRSRGDVVEEVVDLLVQPAEQARTRFEGKFSRGKTCFSRRGAAK